MIHHKFKTSGKTFIVIIILIIFFYFSIIGCSQTTHINRLIQRFNDEDKYVRNQAAMDIGEIGEPAIDPLIEALEDEDWKVRSGAISALRSILWEFTSYFYKGDIEDKELKEIFEPTVEPLIKTLKDEDYHVREDAAGALSHLADEIKDKEILEPAVEPLIEVLRDKDSRMIMKVNAEGALRDIGEPAVESLIKALKDEDICGIVGEILISIGDERAIEPLIEALNRYDSKYMAEDFLNSGNIQLEKAAIIWGKEHGYTIIQKPGLGGPTWRGNQ